MSEFRMILVPYDFSPHARVALAKALDLARALEADVHLLHVIERPAYAYAAFSGAALLTSFDLGEVSKGVEASLQALIEESKPLVPASTLKAQVLEGVGISDTIREVAEQIGADLIVMGTHGRTGLAHVFLGSVTERTLRRAPCPVLTVQAASEDDPEADGTS